MLVDGTFSLDSSRVLLYNTLYGRRPNQFMFCLNSINEYIHELFRCLRLKRCPIHEDAANDPGVCAGMSYY